MPTLTTTLMQSFQKHASQLTGKRVWLACSGGRDSMVLAYLTHQLYLQGELPFSPQLIHVNHGLQQANDDWAQQVSTWANTHNIPCKICHANLQSRQGTNEQSARNGRYAAMAKQMAEGDVLMLAHHGDDQAETLLMRLFNGAGVAGLSAMQAWSARQVAGKQINLWRPWLTATRADITAYAQANNLPYIDDPTNLASGLNKGDNKRSWLRAQLMPVIAQQYPQAVANISRSAQLLSNANNVLTTQAADLLSQTQNTAHSKPPYQNVLDIDAVLALTPAEQSLLIHTWLQGDKASEPLPPNKQRVDDVLKLINRTDNDHQTQIEWQGNHQYTVSRYRGQLYRLRADWLAWLKQPVELQCCDVSSITNGKLNIKDDGNISWQLSLDGLTLKPENSIKVRALFREDKIILTGHGVAKSGKKLLQDLAVPTWCRDSMALVLVDDKPVLLASPMEQWHLSYFK